MPAAIAAADPVVHDYLCRDDADHDDHHQREAIAYQKTDAFADDMKQRASIERVIAGLVRYNGARNAESFGLRNADFQVRMAAIGYNLKRFAALKLEEKQALKRRQRLARRHRDQANLVPKLPHPHPLDPSGRQLAHAPPHV